MKVCSKCKEPKDESEFRFRKEHNKLYGRCADCMNKKQREVDKKRYDEMTPEKKEKYIAKKSSQNQHRFKTKPEALAKKKLHDKSDKGCFSAYKGDAKRRRTVSCFNLTFEQFSSIINSNCFYCGKENCRGVDRYDSNQGYTLENSVPCCKPCNEIKMARTVEDMYSHLIKMAKHYNKNKNTILRLK